MKKVGIIGAGAMGSGIAQVASTAGHSVVLFDTNAEALSLSKSKLASVMDRLVEKGRLTSEEAYKLLGLKKGASKEEVLKAANQLQKKIHPDMNRNVDSSRLSQLVNEAKEKIIKTDLRKLL